MNRRDGLFKHEGGNTACAGANNANHKTQEGGADNSIHPDSLLRRIRCYDSIPSRTIIAQGSTGLYLLIS
jgi:hypothetical protein